MKHFLEFFQKVTFAPNPALLRLDGLLLGVTSSDILQHLAADEIRRVVPGAPPPDRIAMMCEHVLRQRT